MYLSSHNHGSGKWPPWRLKSSSRTPIFHWTMIMGERWRKGMLWCNLTHPSAISKAQKSCDSTLMRTLRTRWGCYHGKIIWAHIVLQPIMGTFTITDSPTIGTIEVPGVSIKSPGVYSIDPRLLTIINPAQPEIHQEHHWQDPTSYNPGRHVVKTHWHGIFGCWISEYLYCIYNKSNECMSIFFWCMTSCS